MDRPPGASEALQAIFRFVTIRELSRSIRVFIIRKFILLSYTRERGSKRPSHYRKDSGLWAREARRSNPHYRTDSWILPGKAARANPH